MHHTTPPPPSWFEDAPQDEDIVIGQETVSLKCPITLTLLEKPVRSINCPHVFSLDAIKELIKLGRGECECPVPGCAAQITLNTVREDRIMARRVMEEKAREEQRVLAQRMDTQDVSQNEIVVDDVKFAG